MYRQLIFILTFFSFFILTCSPSSKVIQLNNRENQYHQNYINTESINKSILYNKVQNYIKQELYLYPNHKLLKNDVERYKIAKIIVDSSETIDTITWQLLFAVIRYESSFKHSVIANDKPSIGMMQLHGRAWSYCSEVLRRRINKNTIEDQIQCGGLWLDHSIRLCKGDIGEGLARYATGYMCNYSESSSVSFIVKRRLKLIDKLNNY
jgi:hypothetical protein